MKTNELIDEATSPPPEELAKVVDSLLQTFNRPDETQAAAWLDLARRRLAELHSGQVKSVPGEEVFARIRHRYDA